MFVQNWGVNSQINGTGGSACGCVCLCYCGCNCDPADYNASLNGSLDVSRLLSNRSAGTISASSNPTPT